MPKKAVKPSTQDLFVTRRQVLSLLYNLGLVDKEGVPIGVKHTYDIEELRSYVEAHVREYHAPHAAQPWYRRLWARIARREG